MTIEGATVIRTGFSRGSGYDKIFLKTVDGKILVLKVETTSDDDMCIGISDVLNTLKKRIKSCKEDIKEYEERIEEMKKW
jgi:chaperonin cofactor prefoldin